MSRYIVGIDLGTTNSLVGYVDTADEQEIDAPAIHLLRIPQVVAPGTVEERDQLPSFLYLPPLHEQAGDVFGLPWGGDPAAVIGEYARTRGAEVPNRLIASAKSWLCHTGVDRTAPILPWGAPEDLAKLSPLDASTRYLVHLQESWNQVIAGTDPDLALEHQDVLLTVPASFDPAARELTLQAARQAGLAQLKLLEEPQASFYAWVASTQGRWRREIRTGDVVLVCDVGGGTTDFTMIAVDEEHGELVLNRVAVGEHILLGGDNMDLALAYAVQHRLSQEGTKLDSWQLRALAYSCRVAKEALLQPNAPKQAPIAILGRGRGVVGGTIRTELGFDEVERVLVDGFFPRCASTDRPKTQRRAGIQEIGLPYTSDPAISRHLAKFLTQQKTATPGAKTQHPDQSFLHPTAVLFNGGVMKAPVLRDRITDLVSGWTAAEGGGPVRTLVSPHLEQAVARGAVYYGLARRGRGVRIRGGSPRTYYIGIETSMPAVPGIPAPLKALCVVPFGMEEGTEADIPDQEFGLVVGGPVEFRFLGSRTRRHDRIGQIIEEWGEDIEELTPLETALTWEEQTGATVPVRLRVHVTEMGTLELWCIAQDDSHRWKLEFNVRATGQESS